MPLSSNNWQAAAVSYYEIGSDKDRRNVADTHFVYCT